MTRHQDFDYDSLFVRSYIRPQYKPMGFVKSLIYTTLLCYMMYVIISIVVILADQLATKAF